MRFYYPLHAQGLSMECLVASIRAQTITSTIKLTKTRHKAHISKLAHATKLADLHQIEVYSQHEASATNVRTSMRNCGQSINMWARVHVRTHARTHPQPHTPIHPRAHARTHRHIHAHTHNLESNKRFQKSLQACPRVKFPMPLHQFLFSNSVAMQCTMTNVQK